MNLFLLISELGIFLHQLLFMLLGELVEEIYLLV